MRPVVRFLSDELVERIISEARDILCKLGTEILGEEEFFHLLDEN